MTANGNYLKDFWITVDNYNTTSSGLDSHSLKSWNQHNPDFREWLFCIRKEKPYHKLKKVPLCKGYSDEFVSVVNAAVDNVRNNKQSVLYDLEQVKEFLRLVPNTIVYENEGRYIVKSLYRR